MATENRFFAATIQALEDLSGSQYHAIAFDDGLVANLGHEAGGIILGKPVANDHAEIGYLGEIKFAAGAAVSAGARVTVTTSGWFITAASGDWNVGRCKETVTSGSIGTGLFDFTAPNYRVSSL